MKYKLTHLEQLEAESIFIMREVAAEFDNPVMLYSVGKDSSVMVQLARKAFYPGKIPFPLLHVDTTYKFNEMYKFRDEFTKSIGADLIVYTHPEASNVNPFDYGTQKCCKILKTQALLNALKEGGYDAAIGGARREEERSRSKERIFSFRNKHGRWDPKSQRPELWNLFNAEINKGESMRVFPLSNWTELDVWMYITKERIPVVPMYFAKERDMVVREGQLIPIEGSMDLGPGEKQEKVMCRFRTLGCWPCTGAVRSESDEYDKIVDEIAKAKMSERITRIIDFDTDGSMELKKREGYF
jgi:sulfate adenylyltransferase subunit 2